MNSASIIFGLVIATLIGALFHLWRDGGFWRLLFYLIFSIIGFFLGHFLAGNFNLNFFNVGGLRLAGAVLGSMVMLFFGHWLVVGGSSQAGR